MERGEHRGRVFALERRGPCVGIPLAQVMGTDVQRRWHEAARADVVVDSLAGLPGASTPLPTVVPGRPERYADSARCQCGGSGGGLSSSGRSGIVTLPPIGDADAPDVQRLMLKYADRPMDFVDATPVRLAEREGLATILSADRDFEAYRMGGRKVFRVLPRR